MNEVMITGSFDPVTNGHVDIIKRAARIFGAVAVVMFINEAKEYMFTAEKRLEMLRAACEDMEGVRVDSSNGYVVEYAAQHGIKTVIRGIRNSADLEYEVKMAEYNREKGGIETLFLMADERLSECSSTLARKKIREKESLGEILPQKVLEIAEKGDKND